MSKSPCGSHTGGIHWNGPSKTEKRDTLQKKNAGGPPFFTLFDGGIFFLQWRPFWRTPAVFLAGIQGDIAGAGSIVILSLRSSTHIPKQSSILNNPHNALDSFVTIPTVKFMLEKNWQEHPWKQGKEQTTENNFSVMDEPGFNVCRFVLKQGAMLKSFRYSISPRGPPKASRGFLNCNHPRL